jgi:hypothetical protein
MKRIFRILTVATLLALSGQITQAQTLLYRWAFTNSTDTFTNSANNSTNSPGTGNLLLQNVTGSVYGTAGLGLDAVNPLSYFTNSAVTAYGPANGIGAFVGNGQGYSGGNTAIGMCTNLNIGSQFQFTVTFWFQMGALAAGQFPRPVEFVQMPGYDTGGKGLGNVSDVGASVNTWSGSIAQSFQNGIANATSSQNNIINISANASLTPGFQTDGATWYFEAITYDGTVSANNFTTWIGLTNASVQSFVQSANYGPINFTTNATVYIGGNDVPASPRSLSSGAVADVRFYSGVCSSNNLERIRNFMDIIPVPNPLTNATVLIQPVSGSTYVSGSRTFSVTANGNPAVFNYQWYSNNVAITGATNASLILTNVQPSANGASFVCAVSNVIGGSLSSPAIVSVSTPVTGSYAKAVFTNNPYSFWLVNEPSNTVPVLVSDYVNGHDGYALDPTNMAFPSGPNSPFYSGFPAANTSIETFLDVKSRLNMAGPGNYPNTGMTICGWVNTPALGTAGDGIIFNLVSDTGGGFGLLFGSGGNNECDYQWGPNLPLSGFASGLIIPTNEWTFVALVVSTNLTAADNNNSITADTNVTVYVGSHSGGFGSATDSTALNGSTIANGSSVTTLALGRTTVSSSENGSFYAASTSEFSSVAVFYSALSPQAITNLYVVGAKGVSLYGVPDPTVKGNILLTYPVGTLQQANVVQGPYTDVPGAATPYSVPMTNSSSFFQVRPN